jgi:flagellar motility protein MotE (MotC chaperone)
VALNCFRYFGFKSLDEVDRLTIKEYSMLCEAEKYKQVDKQKDIALNAWLTFVASAKKKVGKNLKPVYPTFESFFDYAKELKKLKGETTINDLKQRYKDLQERLTGNVSTHDRSNING